MSTSEKGVVTFVVGLMTFGFLTFLGPGPFWGLCGGVIASFSVAMLLLLSSKRPKEVVMGNAEQFANDVAAEGKRLRDALAAIANELSVSESRKKLEELLPIWDDILRNLTLDPSKALDVSTFHSSVAVALVSVVRGYQAIKKASGNDIDSQSTVERSERQISEAPDRFRSFLSEMRSTSLRHINVELDLLDDREL